MSERAYPEFELERHIQALAQWQKIHAGHERERIEASSGDHGMVALYCHTCGVTFVYDERTPRGGPEEP